MQNSLTESFVFRLILLLGLGVMQISGCRGKKENSPLSRGVDDLASGQSIAKGAESSAVQDEFRTIAVKIRGSENRYLGAGQIARLQRQRELSQSDVGQAVNLDLQLCWNHLRLGNIEDAKAAIDSAFALVEKSQGKPQASMHKLRALVFMREAEFRNCVQQHNSECCLFPLQGGGVHQIKKPALQARSELLSWLKLQPNNLEAAWLLNVGSQAVGDFPEGVTAQYRIPESVFQSDKEAPALNRFVDRAQRHGIDAFNLCGGAIVEDFNGDGLLDIVTSSYDPGEPILYFEQTPNHFGFKKSPTSNQLGGLNCIAADYDGDGDSDVLVLRGAWLEDDGRIRNSLLQNDGNGNFVDVSRAAGIGNVEMPTQAAAWGDLDNDGDLDLFIGNESRAELSGSDGGDYPSELYRNNGDGTFTDIASTAGVTNDRYCKGVALGDYDNDGDLDIYVSNRGPNRLYRNDGSMRFVDVAADLDVDEPVGQSFASWFFDYNNDGWLDLFVASYQASNADVVASYLGIPNNGKKPCLYRNNGDGTFANVTRQAGLDRVHLPMGANFGDIDNDGFLDIYLTTGRPDFATLTPNVMYRNDRGIKFQDVTTNVGLGHLQKGHGVAFADLDNDGDQDIYHQLGGFYPGDKFHNAFFQNQGGVSPDETPRFINITLEGRKPNSNGLGARIRVVAETPEGEREVHRAVGVVSSFGGSPARQAIGLGNATAIKSIEVRWPFVSRTGTETQIFNEVALDSFITIQQGRPDVLKKD